MKGTTTNVTQETSDSISTTADTQQEVDTSGVIDQSDVAGQDNDSQRTAATDTSVVDKQTVSHAIQAEKAKLKQKYETALGKYKNVVDRLASLSGMDADQLAQRLDAYTQQLAAQNSGMSPEIYQHLSGMTDTVRGIQRQNLELQRKLEENELKANPTYADFDEVRDDVYDYADKYNVSLRESYWAVNGDRRAEQIARETEQRLIAQREQVGDLGVVSGDYSTSSEGVKFESRDEAEAASIFGMSADEYRALEKAKDIDDWLSWVEKKKGKK